MKFGRKRRVASPVFFALSLRIPLALAALIPCANAVRAENFPAALTPPPVEGAKQLINRSAPKSAPVSTSVSASAKTLVEKPIAPVARPAAVAAVATAAQAKASASAEVALGGDVTRTRFLIGLDKQVEFQVFSLSNPNRVIVELPDVPLQLPPEPEENISVGLVSSFRAGLSAPGKTRVVIAVTQAVVVVSAKLEKSKDGKGHRLALEIVPVEAGTSKQAKKAITSAPYALGATGLQPPLPAPAVRPEVKAAKAFKPIIVIDPGHGGHDSGAVKNGAVEKDVVLAFGRALKDKLEASGQYKVMMTRDTDVFVELDGRVAYAEQNKANLFMAIHADYSDDNSRARGATIYSLRESVANALQRSAKGDEVLSKAEAQQVKQASVEGDFSAVKNILADLAGRDVEATRERTSVFSRSVIELMSSSTEMRNEPEQQAAFRVLKTAKFPSVLIELAYVTNKEDAALLQSGAWRDKVSDSIKTAVDNYFGSQIARLPM
ncbi:MAG: N-acetylmuramoyl-L-alanine amidase [Hyphomicrobium sp.]